MTNAQRKIIAREGRSCFALSSMIPHQLEEIVRNRFGRLRKSLPVAIVAIVLLLSAVTVYSQSSTRDVVPVLEGLDPVMLVQGKEVQGDLKIAVTRGKFQYLFANAENKATFEKDPARYEIQLEGPARGWARPSPAIQTFIQSIRAASISLARKNARSDSRLLRRTISKVQAKPSLRRYSLRKL